MHLLYVSGVVLDASIGPRIKPLTHVILVRGHEPLANRFTTSVGHSQSGASSAQLIGDVLFFLAIEQTNSDQPYLAKSFSHINGTGVVERVHRSRRLDS